MTRRTAVHLSSIVLSLAVLLIAGYLILIFYLPHLAEFWDDEAPPVAFWKQALMTAGRLAQNAGWPLLLLLAWLLIAAVTWRIVAEIRWQRSRRR